MTSIEFRKDLFADERDDDLNEIGKPTRRQDILGHVTGRTRFYDDHLFEGLLHMRAVRCPHHHARIRSMDLSAVESAPGVVRVLTARDVPVNLNTLLSLMDFGKDDEEVLSTSVCRFRGEAVAAVIAESEAAARAAVALARIEWEPLPHVLDVYAALEPDAPQVNPAYPGNAFEYHDRYDHQKLRFGDFDKAVREAAHLVEGRYGISPIEQAPVETCGAIAAPETSERYVCHTSTQGLFFSLGTAAKITGLPSSRLHFIGGTVGGGFGGKVDSMHEPLAVLGAMKTGRPVKYMWDREEEMQVGAPRGGETWEITDAVAADGRILGRRFRGFFDSGAYTRLSSYAVIKSVGHLPGPYTIPNVSADVYCVFTHRTPATAMRGFGITGVDFAMECHMDKVAEAVGLDPVELRILNAYRDGDMKAHRRLAKNCALVESCQVAAAKAGWPISAEAASQSSMLGGGEGWRADIPALTATDADGRIGARLGGATPAGGFGGGFDGASASRPSSSAAPTPGSGPAAAPGAASAPPPYPSGGTPAYTAGGTPAYAAGGTPAYAAGGTPAYAAGGTPAYASSGTPAYPSGGAPSSAPASPAGGSPRHSPWPSFATPPEASPSRAPAPPPASAATERPGPPPGAHPTPATGATPDAPAANPSGAAPGASSPDVHRPDAPFTRGVRRPGARPFTSGTRRR